jgi:pyrroline-5-carboxylate reductase
MKITIIGCGNMGSAFAQRLSPHHTIYLHDRNPEKCETLECEGHGRYCNQIHQAIELADIVILAIKPQSLKELQVTISYTPKHHQLVISLLAGTPLAKIKKIFPYQRVVRMMPNLAIVCGEGQIALTVDEPLTEKENRHIVKICEHLGKIYRIDESKFDAFTALAGSGPAFVYSMMEAMVEAGIKMDLDSADALSIVQQMMKGSLLLLEKSRKKIGDLQKQIVSPAGTTLAGLKKFEELKVGPGIVTTFIAAYERAKELSS